MDLFHVDIMFGKQVRCHPLHFVFFVHSGLGFKRDEICKIHRIRSGYLAINTFMKPDHGISLRTLLRRLNGSTHSILCLRGARYRKFHAFNYIVREWVISRWFRNCLLFASLSATVPLSRREYPSSYSTPYAMFGTARFLMMIPVPLNDPSDFSYFDMSGHRKCNLALERFYVHESNPEISAKSPTNQTEGPPRQWTVLPLAASLPNFFQDGAWMEPRRLSQANSPRRARGLLPVICN